CLWIGGIDTPSSMLERAEQSGETRVAVEARQTPPGDGAVAANERGRPAIAKHGIVLNAEWGFGSPRRIQRLVRPREARARPLPAWLDGTSFGPGPGDRLIRGKLQIELAQDVRNDVLDRATHVDMDRVFVGFRLFQDVQLSVEKAGWPEWLFASGQARCEQRPVAARSSSGGEPATSRSVDAYCAAA